MRFDFLEIKVDCGSHIVIYTTVIRFFKSVFTPRLYVIYRIFKLGFFLEIIDRLFCGSVCISVFSAFDKLRQSGSLTHNYCKFVLVQNICLDYPGPLLHRSWTLEWWWSSALFWKIVCDRTILRASAGRIT